ncbi:hypothetical protein E6P09_10200 [Haloferax mediterranei ATCC 33500]|uniref:Metal-binding protein n=1 Tax=Haloferax mediterranei (strain ATCC 33500 / DSM 1411 / JCM 8866 / NBRC 14739 / NCIMB 2177 / R-4) TaxID=523841 RepID=I3R4I4_HALMT|nr:UPF0058 family protein [Haloferax mediterranei]AFK19144.1 hypothetical protein HFX_1435 [Haloferax mediterranei ATCC 33500]AHZ21494.1 hypothetical protein BM92_01985 [Haloferax mediterranei ATCC 33500]EMA03955.1 hypothetical protein C439_03318 [Haloferax mediterranei ATCC 33500]MDX5989241.1 UPF0058 family protein [Haloferax mediterranei ATCC 33500]QCQ75615.1 hypothetical protein E6P09_10200 [Haloferax mediterranei ATCC 33500]
MKKNELIHLHTLLVEIGGEYLEAGVASRDDLQPYYQLDIGPVALRCSRDDHEYAVRTLMTALAVCAAHDLGRDPTEVPGQHLLRDDATTRSTDQRVTSH